MLNKMLEQRHLHPTLVKPTCIKSRENTAGASPIFYTLETSTKTIRQMCIALGHFSMSEKNTMEMKIARNNFSLTAEHSIKHE